MTQRWTGAPVRASIGGTMRCLILLLLLSAALAPVFAPAGVAAQDPAAQIFAMVNALRAEVGLPPFRWDSALAAAAQAHTLWRAQTGQISHTGAGGSSPKDRAVAAGYGAGAWVDVAENIVEGHLMTTDAAIRWWRNSPVHYNTMTSPYYVDAGVGYTIAEDGYKRYTLVVGRVGSAPPAQPSGRGQGRGAAAAGPPPTPAILAVNLAEPRTDGAIIHIVQRGQALWTIAAVYKVDLDELLALNGLEEGAYIHEGDEVVVRPPDTPTPTDTPPPPTATATPRSLTATPRPTEAALLPSLTPTPDPSAPTRFVANGALVIGVALLGVAGVVAALGFILERLSRR